MMSRLLSLAAPTRMCRARRCRDCHADMAEKGDYFATSTPPMATRAPIFDDCFAAGDFAARRRFRNDSPMTGHFAEAGGRCKTRELSSATPCRCSTRRQAEPPIVALAAMAMGIFTLSLRRRLFLAAEAAWLSRRC